MARPTPPQVLAPCWWCSRPILKGTGWRLIDTLGPRSGTRPVHGPTDQCPARPHARAIKYSR